MKKSNLIAICSILIITLFIFSGTVFGADALYIDEDGDVGIGTTTDPVSKLDLGTNYSDPSTYPNKITLWSGGANNYFGFGISSGDLDYFSQGDHRFYTGYNGSAGSEKMVIASGGNIGIGTTSPTQKLDVRGAIRQVMNSSYDLWLQGGESTSGGDNRNLAILGVDEDSGDKLYLNYNSEYAGGTVIGGKVGIGTTSPGVELEVEDSNSSYVPQLRLHNTYNANTTGYGTGIEFGFSTDYQAYKKAEIRAVASGAYANDIALTFWTGGSTSGDHQERMRIEANGNIKLINKFYLDMNDDEWIRLLDGNGGSYQNYGIAAYKFWSHSAYASWSDERLKEDIKEISNALDKISQLVSCQACIDVKYMVYF